MRKYVHLLLALGILTANPVRSQAQGLLSGLGLSKSAQQQANQQKAEQVAGALKRANLNGYDLGVEVRGDTAKITGKVRDVTHRVLAERAARSVPGVSRVLNELSYVPQGGVQQTSARYVDNAIRPATFYESAYGESDNGIEQVHYSKPGKRKPKKQSTPSYRQNRPLTQSQTSRPAQRVPDHQVNVVQQTTTQAPQPTPPIEIPAKQSVPQDPAPQTTAEAPVVPVGVFDAKPETATALAPLTRPEPQAPSNQAVAQNIANSLAEIGLVNYDVEIRYEDGQAVLAGDVATVQQLQAAGMVTSRVPGVRDVDNQLKVMGPIAPASYNAPAMPTGMAPMAMQGAGMQGAPTPIAGAGNYSNPNLPSHAWPAYAAYPNSAAIQYPKQYSASAWPYIGPFYPYPQVPLGWREVSLQWDDGHWQLDFEKKQKAWYWLWNPKNWH